jgi:hypothetical protein
MASCCTSCIESCPTRLNHVMVLQLVATPSDQLSFGVGLCDAWVVWDWHSAFQEFVGSKLLHTCMRALPFSAASLQQVPFTACGFAQLLCTSTCVRHSVSAHRERDKYNAGRYTVCCFCCFLLNAACTSCLALSRLVNSHMLHQYRLCDAWTDNVCWHVGSQACKQQDAA